MNNRAGTTTFATPAAIDFGTVKFAVVSDIHFDTTATRPDDTSGSINSQVEQLVEDINRDQQLAFVMCTGDLLLNGEKENCRRLKQHLDHLLAPYYVIAGNHDYIPADSQKRREGFTYLTIEDFVTFFTGHGYDHSGKRYYGHQVTPGLRIIGLDGCLPQEPEKWGGILPVEQLEWLEEQFVGHSDELQLLFLHHNFVTWSDDESDEGKKQWYALDNRDNARELLSTYADTVPVAISGHRHIDFNLKRKDGITYIVTPPFCDHPGPYTIFEVTNRAISWEIKSVCTSA